MGDSHPQQTGDAVLRNDVDAAVADIWAEELGIPEVGADTDLATLGCTMGATQRIRARIREEFQVVLPDSAVHPSQTVIGLANQIIVSRQAGTQHPTLVTLRRTGSQPPLFCVSGSGGYAFNFLALAHALGPDQPVYAMHANGLERRGRPDWSVARHARRHLTTVRAIRPTGPYFLLGHSFGGLVALDMAQQLRADGDEVAYLALLDPPLPAPRLMPRAGGHVPEDVATAFRTCMRITGPAGKIKVGALPFLGMVHFPGHYHTDMFFLAAQVALNTYEISPYHGRATLYRPERNAHAPKQWSRLLPADTRQMSVPGDHETMMRPANVGVLAADLADQIRLAAEGDTPAVHGSGMGQANGHRRAGTPPGSRRSGAGIAAQGVVGRDLGQPPGLQRRFLDR